MTKPLVSVITPTYDRPEFLLSAIETVRSQTYPRTEHIIVDDHSHTPATDIVPSDDPNIITYRHDQNKGANTARNTGIDIATGEYIAFLDDDDEWEPTKIERQIDTAEQTGARAVYTGVEQELNGEIFATQTPNLNGNITRDLLTGAPLNSTSTIMFHENIFDKAGKFDEKLPINQDWEFYIRASTVTEFAAIPEPLVTRHHHDSQISDDYIGKRDVTVPRMLEKHLDLASSYGVDQEFKAVLQFSLGATAVRSERWSAARYHYFRSLLLSPSTTVLSRLLALTFGRWSYIPAQKIRRALV
ncbi:glycosyltransferase family 2 protein [Halorubrum ezzemoulense]|uniref:glycosyltransferase family 2 protein n=1 Tax=Halorubrum ezzemoulense TaxID=337243 RepID=UPI00232D436D|nr:glycosyltransferase family 2 protein [Halorubrum ezzemoulense]MDB2282660.1 glycosyltransferase family 2 protein [Halorubrum ezzemoulense]